MFTFYFPNRQKPPPWPSTRTHNPEYRRFRPLTRRGRSLFTGRLTTTSLEGGAAVCCPLPGSVLTDAVRAERLHGPELRRCVEERISLCAAGKGTLQYTRLDAQFADSPILFLSS